MVLTKVRKNLLAQIEVNRYPAGIKIPYGFNKKTDWSLYEWEVKEIMLFSVCNGLSMEKM